MPVTRKSNLSDLSAKDKALECAGLAPRGVRNATGGMVHLFQNQRLPFTTDGPGFRTTPPMTRSPFSPSCAVLLGLCCATQKANAAVDFNREIRPIVAENCFYCHGQDPNHRKGNLRLDTREGALKAGESGEIAVLPCHSESR
jgi:hypothetical protein